jgi:hypothetical protein
LNAIVATLLVLGSKPDPILPPRTAIDAVACANASGRSAQQLGLPQPALTVMSSLLVSGKNPSNRAALEALPGLTTDSLYIYPRPPFSGRPWKQLLHLPTVMRTAPASLRMILKYLGYRYNHIYFRTLDYYIDIVFQLCGDEPEIRDQLKQKVPSTGLIAILLGLREYDYERVIISGFSFEITHAYAANPDIVCRGSTTSLHASTDIAILSRLAERDGRLMTSEPIVHERTGLPLLRVGQLR